MKHPTEFDRIMLILQQFLAVTLAALLLLWITHDRPSPSRHPATYMVKNP